jgi:hypothetical protein
VGLKVCAMPTIGDPIAPPRLVRTQARAKAQRQHQVALEAHNALRAPRTVPWPTLEAGQV